MLLLGLLRDWFGGSGRRRAGFGGWRWCGVPGPGWGCRWPCSEGGEGLGGEGAAGDGGEEVVDGGDEVPFGGGSGCAAHGELAEAEVVLDAGVGGFGDVAALAVGGDALLGFEAFGHGGGGGPVGLSGSRGGAGVAGLFLEVAVLAGGDEPVGAGAGHVVLGFVAGVGEDQADEAPAAGAARAAGAGGVRAGGGARPGGGAGGGGLAGGDEGGGGLGGGEHGLEPGDVAGGAGEAGGDDEAVFAGEVLGVVALDEGAAADGHEPGVRVGGVPGPLAAFPGAGGVAGGFPGPGPVQVPGGLPDPDGAAGRGPAPGLAGQARPGRGAGGGVAGVPVIDLRL